MPLYAQVIIAKPLEGPFTYEIPDALTDRVKPGHRVLVPFGPSRYYTGLVESVSDRAPQGIAPKPIADAPDTAPVIRHPQLKLWQWLADYYLASLGEVYGAAMPAGFKIETESMVEASDTADYQALGDQLTDFDIELVEQLRKGGAVSVKQLAKGAPQGVKMESVVSRLIGLGVLRIAERSAERFGRRREWYVRLKLNRADSIATKVAFQATSRSDRQQHMLLTLIAMSGSHQADGSNPWLTVAEVLERSKLERPILKALADKGLVEMEQRYLSRFDFDGSSVAPLPELSAAQQQARKQIGQSMLGHDVTLLHGVTSSGKTEIYLHLIAQVLDSGNQALMLVPEIALTTQLTRRLQRVFGKRVIIYHSKFTDAERMDVWHTLLRSNEPCVVLGTRSAVFLPFARLGLVIVDEEHEASYKQADPAPRYNGRDAAMVLARMHGAKTLLASATPSIETYYKAKTGKFGLVSLTERFGGVQLPAIEIQDIRRERQRGATTGIFTDTTLSEARRTLDQGHQLIVFHNRRGFSPMACCRSCSFIPKCDHCDVSLTYHRSPEALVCHYCGATYQMPKVCPSCKEPTLAVTGYGTERVEDSVEQLLAPYPTLRMDLDTTRSKTAHADIIDSFSAGKAKILVGTQMVTKGLDFGGVAMVVIASADALIHYPDFRSTERAFNMLEQVAGRAGRRSDTPGRVIIQTREPDNPVLQFVARHDYEGFYQHELAERQAYLYPPFTRVINIYLKHRDQAEVERHAQAYAASLRGLFGNRVHGPVEPKVSRVKSLYIRRIMLKVEPEASMTQVKHYLRQLLIQLRQNDLTKSIQLHYDVDPY